MHSHCCSLVRTLPPTPMLHFKCHMSECCNVKARDHLVPMEPYIEYGRHCQFHFVCFDKLFHISDRLLDIDLWFVHKIKIIDTYIEFQVYSFSF